MQIYIYPMILYCLLNLPFLTQAQLIDDFSDGDFTQQPTWFGQDSFFFINTNKQLQSKPFNNRLNERNLFVNQDISHEMEWRVWLRFSFNPSSQNQVRWILSASDSNLTNCYYVQLGGSTGTTDSISLYKEINGHKICIIPGRAATVGKTNNLVYLKVIRDANGVWELFSDTGTNNQFISEGTIQDSSIKLNRMHGFTFKCTSGNVSNFYADNVYAGLPILDKTAPTLLHFELLNDTVLKLDFSEKINPHSPWEITFSQLQTGHTSTSNNQSWLIHLNKPIIPDSFFTLSLSQISDFNNNLLDTQIIWAYHVLKPGDIILTELLPDPEPVKGLPNAEFIELHNFTRFPVLLKDFSISDPNTQGFIEKRLLAPYQFILLCATKDTLLFSSYGTCIGLNSWPSLNNGNDTIRLKYKEDIWHEIPYHLGYYQDKEKELGGYSLSLINPNHICWGASNWIASKTPVGGTPGAINDVWINQKDSSIAKITGIKILNAYHIEISFNKAIMYQNTWESHLLQQGIDIKKIWMDYNHPTVIHIQFKTSLQHLFEYQFELDPLIDCLQNKSKQKVNFTYLEAKAPKQNELLITEIYYDESRRGNFPQHEFIELYNKTDYPVNLLHMQFSDAAGSVKLPNYIIPAKSYLIICHQDHASAFSMLGRTLGLSAWPSLNNSDILSLRDSNNFLLHQVQYADNWLKNSAKIFSCSIEMIDLNNPCAGETNWQASLNPTGASLGEANSVLGKHPDNNPPQLIRIYVTNLHQLQLTFSEALDSLSLLHSLNFGLNQSEYPNLIYLAPTNRNVVYVNYQNALQAETDYFLQILSFQDCALNSSEPIQSHAFRVPTEPKKGELIINELLFNPKKDAYDFIEIYNVSNSHLDISKLQLCRIGNQGILEEYQLFAEEGIQLAPQQYMAISEFPALAQNNLYPLDAYHWISHKIPTMNDNEGSICLLTPAHIMLDSVSYSDQMHVSFLLNSEGVSLERINPHIPGFIQSNWISAAQTVNFSTPSKRNSQYKIGSAMSGKFSCRQNYFSPDSDNENELLTFQYQTGGGHWVADLLIVSSEGQLVKEICKSTLLANSGEIHWAGDTNSGERAPIGNYLAVWNCYSDNGEIEQEKIVISLLSK